jgi:hypothetical protein
VQVTSPRIAIGTEIVIVSQRGVYFGLLPDDVRKLRSAAKGDQLLAVIQDDIEERWDEPWLFQTDKGWAGIHRCLTDGRLAYDNGEYPLRACVLGGEQLYDGNDFVVSLLTPEQVSDVASALASINKESLRARYQAIDPIDYGTPLSGDDFEYLWNCFAGLPEFFKKVASARRAMVFTVDL